jgi:hypothetical protein
MATKVFAWCNSDLDGVGSTILLGNMFPNFEYRNIFFGDFQKAFTEWFEHCGDDYDKIFVVGIPLDQTTVNKLDDHKIVFVTDAAERPNVFDSTLIQEECTSCTKLLYRKFKDRIDFPLNLKKLFVYIDDYNSYELKHEETKYLNALYRKSGSSRFQKFAKRFWKGFDGFTGTETAKADEFFEELEKELESIDLYKGEYKGFKVLATFSKFSVNELAHSILDNYEVDVVMIVNPDTKFVSFRKAKASNSSAQMMAEKLCDGGGSDFAAGGNITPKFLEFTQTLIEQ